jgi:hypothetical protein
MTCGSNQRPDPPVTEIYWDSRAATAFLRCVRACPPPLKHHLLANGKAPSPSPSRLVTPPPPPLAISSAPQCPHGDLAAGRGGRRPRRALPPRGPGRRLLPPRRRAQRLRQGIAAPPFPPILVWISPLPRVVPREIVVCPDLGAACPDLASRGRVSPRSG